MSDSRCDRNGSPLLSGETPEEAEKYRVLVLQLLKTDKGRLELADALTPRLQTRFSHRASIRRAIIRGWDEEG